MTDPRFGTQHVLRAIAIAAFVVAGADAFPANSPATFHVRVGTERVIRVATIKNECSLMRRFEISVSGPQFVSVVPQQRGGVMLSPGQTVDVELSVNARAFVQARTDSLEVSVRCHLCGPEAQCKQDRYRVPVTLRLYDRPQYRMTVLLYSGRRNPELTITDPRVIASLETLLAAAPRDRAFTGRTIVPSILGYNGIRIDAQEEDTPLRVPLFVYRNRIEARSADGQGREVYIDSGGALESLLLNHAAERKVLNQAQLERIRALNR